MHDSANTAQATTSGTLVGRRSDTPSKTADAAERNASRYAQTILTDPNSKDRLLAALEFAWATVKGAHTGLPLAAPEGKEASLAVHGTLGAACDVLAIAVGKIADGVLFVDPYVCDVDPAPVPTEPVYALTQTQIDAIEARAYAAGVLAGAAEARTADGPSAL